MHLIVNDLLSLLLFAAFINSVPIQDPVTEPISESIDGTTSAESNLDWFYRAPVGFEKAALGSILRYRPIPRPLSFTNVTPIRPKAAWQIQYRTQNSVGEPEASVVTVLEPFNASRGNLFAQAFLVVSLVLMVFLKGIADHSRRILLMLRKSASKVLK